MSPVWTRICLALCSAGLTGLLPAHATPARPVLYGGSGDDSRCSLASVEAGADQPAPLRRAPDDTAPVLAPVNAAVYICDRSQDSLWLGVVVAPAGNDSCLPARLPAQRQPYPGPCRSGWVHISHVFFLEEG